MNADLIGEDNEIKADSVLHFNIKYHGRTTRKLIAWNK
jgi:hypothetical protein